MGIGPNNVMEKGFRASVDVPKYRVVVGDATADSVKLPAASHEAPAIGISQPTRDEDGQADSGSIANVMLEGISLCDIAATVAQYDRLIYDADGKVRPVNFASVGNLEVVGIALSSATFSATETRRVLVKLAPQVAKGA